MTRKPPVREANEADKPRDESIVGNNKIAKAKWLKDYAERSDAQKTGEFFMNLAVLASAQAGREFYNIVMENVFRVTCDGEVPPAELAFDTAAKAEMAMDRMTRK